MANAGLQTLVEALNRLVENQQQAGFAKHVKPPEVFKAESRSEELQRWQDWKFSFESFIGVSDSALLREMRDAGNQQYVISMNALPPDQRNRSEKLYSMLSTLMKNRALRLARGVTEQNGYEAWRVIMKDLQPSTRQRSLA